MYSSSTMNGKVFLQLVYALSVTVRVYSLDRTLTPGEGGGDVVRAVISKIETTNCTLLLRTESAFAPFMRTMAFVETRDGEELNAIGGGIWNVSEAIFMRTQNDSPLTFINCLQQESSQNHIGPLNWTSLTYANLSIPLYSGVAVRMFMHLSRQLETSPRYSMYWNDIFKNSRSSLSEWNARAAILAGNRHEGSYVFLNLIV